MISQGYEANMTQENGSHQQNGIRRPEMESMNVRKPRAMFVNLKNRMHLPGVNQLIAPCTSHLTASQLKRMLSAWQLMDRYHVFGLIQDGRVIGVVSIEEKIPGEGRILLIAVLPQQQRRGLGRRMVLESFCTLGLQQLSAETLPDMAVFYRKLRFTVGTLRISASGAAIYLCSLSRKELYDAYQHEYSAGAVLFCQGDEERLYVLVTELSGNTGLPKGHVEMGETNEQTTLREIFEETGIKAVIVPGFSGEIVYPQGKGMLKHFAYFLASFQKDQEIRSGPDVTAHILPYEQALRKLSFADVRSILREAELFLNTRL